MVASLDEVGKLRNVVAATSQIQLKRSFKRSFSLVDYTY